MTSIPRVWSGSMRKRLRSPLTARLEISRGTNTMGRFWRSGLFRLQEYQDYGALQYAIALEMYNLFNRVNLAPPSATWDGPTHDYGFGVSGDTIGSWTGAPGIGPGEPFNMQLALKFIF
jgi:hypothetical protein